LFHLRPGLCGLQGPRGGIAQQFLELRVELARIDLNGLRRRRPVALTNQTSEHASRCAAVDGDERRLDSVVQTPKVVRVLPGRAVSDELQKVRWDAGTGRDQEPGENNDQRTGCLVRLGPLRLVGHDDRAFQGHPDIIRVELYRLQQETLAGLERDESTDLER
jgi:hypothetical protein